jgi:hypothetical protein
MRVRPDRRWNRTVRHAVPSGESVDGSPMARQDPERRMPITSIQFQRRNIVTIERFAHLLAAYKWA